MQKLILLRQYRTILMVQLQISTKFVRNFVKQTKLTKAIVDLLAREFVQFGGIYANKCAVTDLCDVALRFGGLLWIPYG